MYLSFLKVDVAIQTEIPGTSSNSDNMLPIPPSCSKAELLEGTDLADLDLHVLGTNTEVVTVIY